MGEHSSTAATGDLDAERWLNAARSHRSDYLGLLRLLVDHDSGSYDLDGLRAATGTVEAAAVAEGLTCERIDDGETDVLVAHRPGSGPRMLLLAHLDTVFEPGTAAARPFRVDETTGLAHGPGVADDKCGVVSALITARILIEQDSPAHLSLVFTPDEEIGSPRSQAIVRRLAADADVALCLEAARANGDLVSARKGGADLRVDITGRAAHSGVEPEKGVHAALQMAHTIIALQALNDPARGVTVNAGQAVSGTRPNVVPASATIRADVRAWTVADFHAALDAAEAAARQVHVDGVEVGVVREFAAPPMEATAANRALGDLAVEIGHALGAPMTHVATGGIGDANILAAAGLPVLDGLAPIAGDDHAPTEWLDIGSIAPRVALLSALCDHLARHGLPVAARA